MFYTWIADNQIANAELLGTAQIPNDDQRLQGFKAGTAASAKRVNTALRQSTLITVALMNAFGLNIIDYDLTSSTSDIENAIINTNLFKLDSAFTAGATSTTFVKDLLPASGKNIGSGLARVNTIFANTLGSDVYKIANAYITGLFVDDVNAVLKPAENNTIDLGASNKQWNIGYFKQLGTSDNKINNVYATNFNGALKGNALTATTARIAEYASSDTSKGTIEERLTNLGFKEAIIRLASDDSQIGTIKRQGNYVLIDISANGTYFSNGIYIDDANLYQFFAKDETSYVNPLDGLTYYSYTLCSLGACTLSYSRTTNNRLVIECSYASEVYYSNKFFRAIRCGYEANPL